MGTQSVIVIEPYAGVETPTGHKSDAHFGSETVQRNPNPSTSYNIARCSLGPGSDVHLAARALSRRLTFQ